MSENHDLVKDFEAELSETNNAIVECREQLDGLISKRNELMSKLHDVDMCIVLECIEDCGLSVKEVLGLILSAASSSKQSAK